MSKCHCWSDSQSILVAFIADPLLAYEDPLANQIQDVQGCCALVEAPGLAMHGECV